MLKLKISRSAFCSWYFDKDMLREIGHNCYNTLEDGDDFIITLDSLYDLLGYLPIRLIKNPQALREEDVIDEEIENPQDYEVEWVK